MAITKAQAEKRIAEIMARADDELGRLAEQIRQEDTPVAFRYVLSQAWVGLCREVERAHGTEDVDVHGLVESVQIARER